MNQCLRCNKQCSVASLFCDECRSFVEDSVQQGGPVLPERRERDISVVSTSPQTTIPPLQPGGATYSGNDDIVERQTAPHLAAPSASSSHLFQGSPYSEQANRIEQTLHRLSDAARRIAAAEPGDRRKPKVSRLSPMQDISGEIQRHSTPMRQVEPQRAFSVENVQEGEDLGLPDFWPWLSDSGEIEAEGWSGHTDPLIARRFPDSTEAARIEAEDMQRIAAEGLATYSPPVPRKRPSRIRVAFASLAVLAILALTIDSILVSVAFLNKRPTPSIPNGPPTLTLSATNVTYGQNIILHVRHFTSSSQVYLTRDVEEAITLNPSNATVGPTRSMIRVDASGNADVSMFIESTWDPGFHTIEAEDIQTRYTASTSLHIDNAGPTRPPHLIVDDLAIDLGAATVGANSIRPLRMHNAGSGSIVWSASSNQPWLLLAPNQGTFSDEQTISVGGERANLKPGIYNGMITVSSNVSPSVNVQVTMTVRALPPNPGPVLQVTPPVLSYTAVDGGARPASQYLVIGNPGSQPMHWSLANNTPPTQSQGSFLNSLGSSVNGLNTDQSSGTVAPRATSIVKVNVQSKSLLPGAYTDTLIFSADQNAINSPQNVNISLTVQPACSLQVSTNALLFTAVKGQNNPNNQAVSLSASSSCGTTTSWSATSSAPWLTITPGNGQLKGVTSSTVAVSVNIASLTSGNYNGVVTLTTARSTQAVQVQLTVQPPPPPGAPVLSVSPMNVNFSVTQGQPNPPSQVVSITNTGGSTLYWGGQSTPFPGAPGVSIAPSGGTVAPGQTQQALVSANTRGMAAGSYSIAATIKGFDANNNQISGSPQVVNVTVNIQPPCKLTPPTSGSLSFTATSGSGDPAPQTLSLSATGNCAWPVGWHASVAPAWLGLSPASGSFSASGQSASLSVAPTIASLAPGVYNATISVGATDSSNQQLSGSPQSFTVSLTVQAPCTLQPSPNLTISVPEGQTSSAQALGINESGACARPVSWSVSSNNSWLVLGATSGSDSGAGSSVGVSANASGMQPGSYSGTVTLSATGSGGTPVQGGSQTVAVALTVTGFTINGTVNACADSTCSSPSPLAGANVTLTDSAGTQHTTTADGSGNYSFSNIMLGSTTIAASGNNDTSTNYSASSSINVSGNQTVNLNATPS
jgi:Viral BACON domain